MTDRLDDRIHGLMQAVVDEAPSPPVLPDEPVGAWRAPIAGWAIAVAAAAIVLVVMGGLGLVFGGSEGSVAPSDNSPTPAPETVRTTTSLATDSVAVPVETLPEISAYEFGTFELADWLTTTDIEIALSEIGYGLRTYEHLEEVVGWSNLGPAGEKPPYEQWEFTTHTSGSRGEAYEQGWYVIISEYSGSFERDEPIWDPNEDSRLPGVRISGPHISFFGEGPWYDFQAPRSDQIVSVFVKPPDPVLEDLEENSSASVVAARRELWTFEFAAILLAEMRWTSPGGPRITVTLDQVDGLAGTTLDAWLQVPIVWGVIEGGARFADIEHDRFSGTAEILPIEPVSTIGDSVTFDHPGLGPLSEDHRLILIAHEPAGISDRALRAACEIPLDHLLSHDRIDFLVTAIPVFGEEQATTWPDNRAYPECAVTERIPEIGSEEEER